MKHKFRVGQTVFSPFGVVKIIARWKSACYDVKFMRKDKETGVVRTETWTFDENELSAFTAGGVAGNEDDAVSFDCKKVNGELIGTFKVWVQIEWGSKTYAIQKEFREKLSEVEK